MIQYLPVLWFIVLKIKYIDLDKRVVWYSRWQENLSINWSQIKFGIKILKYI